MAQQRPARRATSAVPAQRAAVPPGPGPGAGTAAHGRAGGLAAGPGPPGLRRGALHRRLRHHQLRPRRVRDQLADPGGRGGHRRGPGHGARPACAIGRYPHYNEDGTFNGHTILVIPAAGRFLDPTIQQFPRVPHTARAALPAIGRLPVPGALGTEPICVDRTDHAVLYVPLPAPGPEAWRSPVIDQRAAEYRAAGANLAAHVFDLMRMPGFRDQTARSPYPRLPRLLAGLDGTTAVLDRGGYRFADPGTGRELRLADIP